MDRSHVNGILSKRLEQYMQECQSDLKITQMNIKQKSFLRSSLGAKWCRYGFEQQKYKKVIQNQIDKLRDQIRVDLYNRKKKAIAIASINADKIISIQTQKELIQMPQYKKLKQALEAQNDIIRLISQIQKLVFQLSYDISNSNNILKMENI